jgi:hypothetical protein
MKLLTILLASIGALEMAFTALADNYKDFAAEGYRWVKIDGPFMCPTKEDLREITRFPPTRQRKWEPFQAQLRQQRISCAPLREAFEIQSSYSTTGSRSGPSTN